MSDQAAPGSAGATRRALLDLAARPGLATADQIAPVLGFSKQTLYKRVRQGLIPHVRIGRNVRFAPVRIIEWLDGGGTGNGHGSCDGVPSA